MDDGTNGMAFELLERPRFNLGAMIGCGIGFLSVQIALALDAMLRIALAEDGPTVYSEAIVYLAVMLWGATSFRYGWTQGRLSQGVFAKGYYLGYAFSPVFFAIYTIVRNYSETQVREIQLAALALASAFATAAYIRAKDAAHALAVERSEKGLVFYFGAPLGSGGRFLLEGCIHGVLGPDPDVYIAQVKASGAGTTVSLMGGTRQQLEAVAEALWHRVWEDGFARRAQLIENHAPVEQQVNVAGNATFNMAPAELREVIARLEGLQRLGGDLSAMRAHLERIELRLAKEGEVPELVRRWGGEE